MSSEHVGRLLQLRCDPARAVDPDHSNQTGIRGVRDRSSGAVPSDVNKSLHSGKLSKAFEYPAGINFSRYMIIY
jgi:hypothetical protein